MSCKAFRLVCLLLGLMSGWNSTGLAEAPSVGEKLFALKVQPIFQEKCAGCHSESADSIESGFLLDTREQLLAGGDSWGDSVVVPGEIEDSYLLGMLSREEEGFEMPPKEAEKLTEEEVWAIRDWIQEGAPWPDDERIAGIYRDFAEGVVVQTSGGLSESWTNRKYDPEDLWAFQPIQTEFPELSDACKCSPVDSFIDQQLDERGILSAPRASRQVLIRRATFDLLGLPPTPAEVQEFVDDPRDDNEAFAALVDRLLESPHYGEQWGRHWLDVVRYADSSGFANDYERPNAWRFRDYVVRAFNADKPFDKFIQEQIAGDELAEANGDELTQEQRTELLVASGFLRMGPWEHTGMSVAKVTRQLFLDDITDTVGQVFLGQALQCCRCHDHKFDPIPTRDFYSVQAVFATTQFAEIETEWLPDENLAGMEEDKKYHRLRHAANEKVLQELHQKQAEYEAEWFRERGMPYKTKAEAKKAGVAVDELPNRTLKTAEEFGKERIGRKWQHRFNWEFDRYKPFAYSTYSGVTRTPKSSYSRIPKPDNPSKGGELEKTAILGGGDPFSPTIPVQPGVLSAVPGALEVSFPASHSGRRTAFAQWVADPENTLTSRVLVNRIWAFHFGRGIAGNPNNFGTTGKKPTHPKLLDWLATEFVSNGWSIKHLHRVIMNTDAYCRSTTHFHPEQLSSADPSGTSYAVFLPRRLEAEEIRDATLSVSGELNPALGGIPIRPDMNLEAALQPRMIMGTFAPSYVPNPDPNDRNRRSIYIHKIRGHRIPFLETFNQPGSETSCEMRDQSNITPQVFAMLNGQEANDRALALAKRVLDECDDEQQVVRQLFELCFGRLPTDAELQATQQHWDQMNELQKELHFEPVEYPVEVVREAVDENTGERFEFTEKLFAYQDYIPDLQPHQVDARTRALADVCLVLLNSNEFVYVY
ncbi:Planctomycete cytochrome C [Thalassoglobus neptunius]|uniref:Planctomycete cytochrome C n=1 Tax=Thalassoglobus neptunius TaxID=1938619 RepID=A0A5C5WZ93_9PLAN|nr:PSD1 and planctomycete cytochrome C domain-containing protein [Thalassoglobus neptunius]TWT55411.1 Planctomycete cytochrome C [Thalassoglobus neptunius]